MKIFRIANDIKTLMEHKNVLSKTEDKAQNKTQNKVQDKKEDKVKNDDGNNAKPAELPAEKKVEAKEASNTGKEEKQAVSADATKVGDTAGDAKKANDKTLKKEKTV